MDTTDTKALEDFLVDISCLDPIVQALSPFNVFDVMKVSKAEIRHSNVLAWLMNPQENHGLGDAFIKRLLQMHFQSNTSTEIDSISVIKASLMDFDDFAVRREWNNIDLLAVSEREKFLLIIENKVDSNESADQLKKYQDIIEHAFPDYKKAYVFLTPEGMDPSDTSTWSIMTYQDILDTLKRSIQLKGEQISANVRSFLDQYATTIRRHIVGDSELEKICLQIYNRHKRALDMIYEYRPDVYLDLSQALTRLIEEDPLLVVDAATKSYVRFGLKDFDDIIPLVGEGWSKEKRLLLFVIDLSDEKVVFKITLGPGNEAIRNAVYQATQKVNLFKVKKKATSKWSTIFSKDILSKTSFQKLAGEIDIMKARVTEQFNMLIHIELKESLDELRKELIQSAIK